jgi:hypothetical protein
MKKNIWIVLLTACSMSVFAQRSGPSGGDRQIERMKTELALSEDQYTRLKKAHEEFEGEMRRMRADTALTREKAIAGRKVMIDKRSAALKEILTKEQYQKWMTMKPGESRKIRQGKSRAHNYQSAEDLKEALGLSDDQAKKVKQYNAEMTGKFQKLRADTTVARANRMSAFKEIVADRNEKIKKVLTEDQYENFLAFEQERVQMRRRGAGSGSR